MLLSCYTICKLWSFCWEAWDEWMDPGVPWHPKFGAALAALWNCDNGPTAVWLTIRMVEFWFEFAFSEVCFNRLCRFCANAVWKHGQLLGRADVCSHCFSYICCLPTPSFKNWRARWKRIEWKNENEWTWMNMNEMDAIYLQSWFSGETYNCIPVITCMSIQ